jgi:hypothetical protein
MVDPPLAVETNRQSRDGFQAAINVSKCFCGYESYFIVFLPAPCLGHDKQFLTTA